MGASRVYLGVHWPSDVIGSYVLRIMALVGLIGLRNAFATALESPWRLCFPSCYTWINHYFVPVWAGSRGNVNWIDIAILVVWGVTVLWGFSAGLLQILVPLLSLVVGMALSSRIGDSVGEIFSSFTDNENAQTVGGFILIVGVLFIAGGIISFMARRVLGIIPLFGLANSLAGMAVGLLVGFLLISGVLTAIQRFPVRDLDVTIDESTLGTFMADQFDVVIRGVGLIPGDWDSELDKLTN